MTTASDLNSMENQSSLPLLYPPRAGKMHRIKAYVLAVATVASLLLFLVPAYLIRPFISQTPRGVAIAFVLRQASPWVTLALLGLGVWLILSLWHKLRSNVGWALLLFSFFILTGTTVLSRWNYFEWIFHPMPQPGFSEARKSSYLQDSDMVLGVEMAGEARAYPVRIMAYHHVVNDWVGGVPLVATY
jgi:hypothetical protein